MFSPKEKITHEYQRMYPLEERKAESERILKKYPDRVPIIIESSPESKLNLDKKKFLVPTDITMGQFTFIIRKRLKVNPEKAIFLFANNTLVAQNTMMSDVYKKHKNLDNFLMFTLKCENTFGDL